MGKALDRAVDVKEYEVHPIKGVVGEPEIPRLVLPVEDKVPAPEELRTIGEFRLSVTSVPSTL